MNGSFGSASDVLVLRPSKADLAEGARYAAITLPWTFNRMMLNTGSDGQQRRGLNIAKGIVAQEMLKRKLLELRIPAATQRKSHRSDDLFDFHVGVGASPLKLDLKTINYYTDYIPLGRQPLSERLIVDSADYPGPDWRRFFPMLVPHTQIGQHKQAYCFAIASSINLMNDSFVGRSGFAFTAFPYGPLLPFLSSRRLCLAREAEGKGIKLTAEWQPGLTDNAKLNMTVLGERNGEQVAVGASLSAGKPTTVGPFSCVSSFQVDKDTYSQWSTGIITLTVAENGFRSPVLDSRRRNINKPPADRMVISQVDFCNLVLPDEYVLYVIGWITKPEYLNACRQYTGWVWPLDSVNKFENQAWSQITEKDAESITRAGFDDCIVRKPTLLRAGWMKTNGHGGGACCYVYPNIGARGGVKETNLYVLPKDMRTVKGLPRK